MEEACRFWSQRDPGSQPRVVWGVWPSGMVHLCVSVLPPKVKEMWQLPNCERLIRGHQRCTPTNLSR